MNNRRAKLLLAKPGQLIRISNSLLVRYAPSGVDGLPTHYFEKNEVTSICRCWMYFGTDREPDTFESPDDCTACRHKVNKKSGATKFHGEPTNDQI